MVGVLADDPTTYDTAHLSVIAFGDVPVAVLPLTPLRSDPALPRLPRQASTDYAQVFLFLNRMLRDDQQRFARAGLQSYTPVVFFLTDGNPQVNGQLQRDEVWLPVRRNPPAACRDWTSRPHERGPGSRSHSTGACRSCGSY